MITNVYQRKDGRFEGRITVSRIGGKRQYKAFFGRTPDDVITKMTDYRERIVETAAVCKTFSEVFDESRSESRTQHWQIMSSKQKSIYFQYLQTMILQTLNKAIYINLSERSRTAAYQTAIFRIISDLFIDLHCYCHSLFLLYTSSFSYYTGFLFLVAHFFIIILRLSGSVLF